MEMSGQEAPVSQLDTVLLETPRESATSCWVYPFDFLRAARNSPIRLFSIVSPFRSVAVRLPQRGEKFEAKRAANAPSSLELFRNRRERGTGERGRRLIWAQGSYNMIWKMIWKFRGEDLQANCSPFGGRRGSICLRSAI